MSAELFFKSADKMRSAPVWCIHQARRKKQTRVFVIIVTIIVIIVIIVIVIIVIIIIVIIVIIIIILARVIVVVPVIVVVVDAVPRRIVKFMHARQGRDVDQSNALLGMSEPRQP